MKQSCSAFEQKQREVAVAAATKLKTLRRRNNPTICGNSLTSYAIPV
ncbi:MAG: hypothetical protein WBD73_09115 [Candidatus Acidiferrales bacterium]